MIFSKSKITYIIIMWNKLGPGYEFKMYNFFCDPRQ